MWTVVEETGASIASSQEGWGAVSLKLGSASALRSPPDPAQTSVSIAATAMFAIPDELQEQQLQERNIAHASELCEEATAAAVAGKMTVAVAKFQQALFYRPDYAQGHEMRAQLLSEMGRSFDSVQAATAATTLNPEWPDAWITLARCQANLGEPEMAVESVEKARELAGDMVLLEDEVSGWRRLCTARTAEQEESRPCRVNVVEATEMAT